VGCDLGSGGDPVVPWAVQLDLPPEVYGNYNGGTTPRGPVQIYGNALKLPFADGSLDFLYSSHLLEDFPDWWIVLPEWVRVLKKGGRLIVLLPDKERFAKAVENGQPRNAAHLHEGRAGELTEYSRKLGLKVIEDRLTNLTRDDYSILFVGTKL
jgi:ubiquinone/menaquinone biosynthesis C-methylase UbiE